jgi:hypothetical protein
MNGHKFAVGEKLTVTFTPEAPQKPYYQHGTVSKLVPGPSYVLVMSDGPLSRCDVVTPERMLSA